MSEVLNAEDTPNTPDVRPFDRKLPPVVEIAMVALAAAITGGVIIASRIGEEASLAFPVALMAIAILLEIVAIALLARISPFAWARFWLVIRWALVAYVIQSAIIEWSFIKNDVPGRQIATLSAGLVVFATAVPLMITFTVARYQAVASAD